MDKPKISIITATYNRLSSGFLAKCIESVNSQSPGEYEYEHIIVDDGSTDATEELVSRLMRECKSIVYYRKPNGGAASSYRYGILKATGDYITFLDDDDLLPVDSLKIRAEYVLREDPDWFYGKAEWIDEKGGALEATFQSEYYPIHLYERQLISNVIHSGTPVVRAEALRQIAWPSWLDRSQDYFIWLELLRPANNYRVGFLDATVYSYRIHGQAYTANVLSTAERFSAKETLNHRIRLLHGSGSAFLAEEAYMARKELWKAHQEIERLAVVLRKITGTRIWKLIEPIRTLYRSLREKNAS